MNNLFGIPMTNIMVALLILLGLSLLTSAYVALRNPVIFRMGVRNVPRRPAQTALIVIGLMLSTLIISAAFTTGDTVNYSIGNAVYKALGRVDEIVRVKQDPNAAGLNAGADRVPTTALPDLEARFKNDPDIAGFVPSLTEAVPLLNPRTQQSEPIGLLSGVDPQRVNNIGGLLDTKGNRLDIGTLKPNEVYVNETGVDKLDAKAGDTVQTYYNNQLQTFTIVGVARDSIFNGASGQNGQALAAVLLPLDRAQAIIGKPGYGAIFVANKGDVRSGMKRTDAVAAKLDPVLSAQNLTLDKTKQDNVKLAETFGNVFTTFFIVLGLFAIAAGVLLIFLIFSMLAAERKSEMGMARAVGTQRRHLIQMFIAEGTAYDLLSAAVGAALGVGVALAIVGALRQILGSDLSLTPNVQPRSIIVAYCLGVVLTFLTITFSSFRISRLNIVAAIRDIEEGPRRKASRRSFYGGVAMLALGALFVALGLSAKQTFPFNLGVMLLAFGLAFVLRRFAVPERAVFTTLSLVILVWWCLPFSVQDKLFGKLKGGIEMFFFSGIALVTGAVLLIMFNSDLILRLIAAATRPFGKFAPAMKTGIAYPLANRGRTGMTLAMFGLIIFALVVMSTTNVNFANAFTSDASLGGWDVAAQTNNVNPVPDFKAAVQAGGRVNTDDWVALGATALVAEQQTQIRQGAAGEYTQYLTRGMDAGFMDHNAYKFQTRATDYTSDRAVWDAIKKDPTLAVVDANALPAQGNFGGGNAKAFHLTGVKGDDTTMQPIAIEVRDPRTGKAQQVKIIGILDNTMNISDGQSPSAGGLFLNDATFQQVFPKDRQLTIEFVSLKKGVDAKTVARGIKATLIQNGVQATSLRADLDKAQQQNLGFTYLLQGFLGLGLVVGIAALGVIAFRSVTERRQQIGMLRALGYQRGMVSGSFLVESLFIAVVGVIIGITTGLVLSHNLLQSGNAGQAIHNVVIPVGQIAFFSVIAIVAAYIMTVIPAQRASRVPIAEALRYE